ncbi:hypothetical protein DH2020_020749 [Rehmannia glutinosa]|uniref:BHLH domain-containing protein n=1 Tax=Rehmannia glutinosa TaxID=99300 RepID=A0ABR0W4S2_REHGL
MLPLHQYASDFGLIDFMDEANIDQFIDLIRGDQNEIEPVVNFNNPGYNFDHSQNIINGGVCNNLDGQFFPPATRTLFDFDGAMGHNAGDHNNIAGFGSQNECQKLVDDEEDEEGIMDDNESSATTTTTGNNTPTNKKNGGNKVDRSRTLISERRRRGRMKEKLYALRSLVPNITKMDKASIVGDAVLYVQDLQMQAKKLKSEIAGLESSLNGGGDKFRNTQNAKKMNATSFYPIIKKIFKMDVFQVEERGFYVRIVSNKGKGVAVSLFKALESLTSFNVQSSNLAAAAADNYVLTFTLHVMEEEMDVNLHNLELWIASVFLNQGFEFETSQSAVSIN